MRNLVFSVIIPTFNRPTELEACLRALASLEYPRERFEIIVVDDGSDVPLAEVVERCRNSANIRMFRQERQGPAAARNAGAALSKGEYLAFTDDDCLPSPGWLSALEKVLQENRDVLVGGRTVNALTGNPYATTSQVILDFVQAHYRSGGNCLQFFASSNLAVHADTFRKMSGFTAAFRTSEDRDFCDRWLAAGYGMVHAPDALVRHAHRLGFVSFWKQHMGYGRGAWRFYRAYRGRHGGKSSIQPGFYWKLVRQLPALVMHQKRNRALFLFLMGMWQAANLAGFLSEALSTRDASGKGIGEP